LTATEASTRGAVERHVVPLPDALVSLVLSPYLGKDCVYIRNAWIEAEAGASDVVNGAIRGRAQLSIAESCYIEDTGHFNAVEFNICFNQLAYLYGAYLASRGLLPGSDGVGKFKENQLAGMLIKELSSRFRRAINPRSFEAEVWIERPAEEKANCWLQPYHIRFWDAAGGSAEGTVLLAFLKPDKLDLGKVRAEPKV
jgi:hypothetical protein